VATSAFIRIHANEKAIGSNMPDGPLPCGNWCPRGEQAKKIKAPTLSITGKFDQIVPPFDTQELADLIPRSKRPKSRPDAFPSSKSQAI
jgi:pimeloyl-ACP methyl ester carboxylesterase